VDWSETRRSFLHPRQVKQQYRTSKELRAILATTLAADNCPSISELSRSLGYKRPERLYQVDPLLCHRITQKHRNSSRTHWWRLRGAKRICDTDKLRTLLEESLAQDPPVPVRRIAKCSGYLNGGFIQRKFPDLCRAIAKKRKLWENRKLEEAGQAVKTACLEQPPPALTDLSKRLGFNHSSSLRLRFPVETDQLLRAQQSYERKEVAELGDQLLQVLDEEPAPSLSHIAGRLGISQSYLREKCPDGSRAISKRYLQDQNKRTCLRRDLLNEEVYRIATDLHAQGKNPTHTTVGHLLSEESTKDWAALQNAIKAARRSLGLAT
jgi:AraC-like DNA-binding protein